MFIALTKKVSDKVQLDVKSLDKEVDPIFLWTCNLTNVYQNSKKLDLLVLVNKATDFRVAIYKVKKKDLKNIKEVISNAIKNTLLEMNMNADMVDEYLKMAGDIELVRNDDRKSSARVSRAGLEIARIVASKEEREKIIYSDIIGVKANYIIQRDKESTNDYFYPYEKLGNYLSEITKIKAYKAKAFQINISLDLKVYKAERKIIVPVDIKLTKLHKVIQKAFDWKDYHLYDFSIIDSKKKKIKRFVLSENDIFFEEDEIIDDYRLSDVFPKYKKLLYLYDFGDFWEHEIKLEKVIENYDGELPYLLMTSGQTPPEDVGGVGGYLNFLQIINNPENSNYYDVKEWAAGWRQDIEDWKKKPRVIHVI